MPAKPNPLPVGEIPITTGTVRLDPERGRRAVTVYVNGVPSSHVDFDDPTRLDFEYMAWFAVVIDAVFDPGAPLRALHVGAAGCTMPRYLAASRPGSRQIAIEIDPELAQFARAHLDVPRSPAVRLRVGDGAEVIKTRPPQSADLIVRDAFAGEEVPSSLEAGDFVREVARVLAPDGLYLANCAWPCGSTSVFEQAAAVSETIGAAAVVGDVSQFRRRRSGNGVIVAAPSLDVACLDRALRCAPVPGRVEEARPRVTRT